LCPVRNATEEQKEKMKQYIKQLEDKNIQVFYPARDNPYEDTDRIGYQICITNFENYIESDEIHIFWDKNSSGTLFDLGGIFMMNMLTERKPFAVVNIENLEITPHKSFANVIDYWSKL